jgi:hypothetical protein
MIEGLKIPAYDGSGVRGSALKVTEVVGAVEI